MRTRLLILLLSAATVRAEEAPAADLASLLPEGTLVALEANDLGGVAAFRREMALGRIWAEPEVQQFVRGLGRSLTEGLAGAQQGFDPLAMVGLQLADFEGIEVRRFGFAVVDFRPGDRPDVDLVLTLQFRKGADKAQKIMQAAQQAAQAFLGTQFEEIEVGGAKVRATSAGPVDLFFQVGTDRIVVTTKRARMEQFLAALGGRVKKPLAASARFGKIVDGMKARRNALLLYVDAAGIGERIAPLVDDPEFTGLIRKIGFDAVEAFALADVPEGAEFRTEYAVTLSERRGLMALIPDGKVSQRFAERVPANCLFYGAGRMDLVQLLDGAIELVGAFEPGTTENARDALARAREALGVDLKQEILGALGPDFAYYVGAPPTGGIIPDVALFAGIADRARAEAAFGRLAQGLAKRFGGGDFRVRVRETRFRGQTLHFVEMTHEGEPVPVAPCWAFGEDFLVLGLFPQTVRHALIEKRALSGDTAFQAALARIPATTISCTYMDTKGIVNCLYNTAAPVLQGCQGWFNQELGRFGVRVNFEDLPPVEVITRHLGPTLYYSATEPGIVRMGYVSPFGSSLLLVGPAVVLGATAAMFYTRVAEEPVILEEAEWEEDADDERDRLRRENARLHERLAKLERDLEELKRLAEEK